ncbi:MAG: hypothetical protein JWL85_542, partial [Candidatus Saccharibacteria bacterium]|nr:hypothetical protein [Candidatus Saccharibacteria bacterium]
MTLINPELPYDPSGYEASPLEGVGVIETDDPYIGQGFAPRVVRFGPEAEQMAFTVPVDDLPLIDTDTILTEDRLTQLEEEETIPSSVEDLLADYDRFTNGEKETFRFSVPLRDEEGSRVLFSFLGSLAARSDV